MKEKVSIFAPNGSKFRTLLYVGIFSLLNKFYIGYTLSYTNTAVDHFKTYIHDSYVGRGIPLSAGTEIWLWSLILNGVFAGDVVGTMITPFFAERFGRKAELQSVYFALVGLAAIPVLLTCLLIMTLKETPKYLLMNKRNTEKALASLKFYQGKNASLNAILEEDDINCVGKSGWTTLKEVFTQAHLRRAVYLGVCAMQLTIGIYPITTELLEAHYTPSMAEVTILLSEVN
ncbi:sugar transporter domain-containing protein [Ditylenchus destructor]|nr:sugar transporter domain-containing protein [Ditylenchus destructor]